MIKPFIKKTTASVLKYCSQLVMEFDDPNLNIDSIYLTNCEIAMPVWLTSLYNRLLSTFKFYFYY